jgi:membrane protease YdiL (CAAX protease family)
MYSSSTYTTSNLGWNLSLYREYIMNNERKEKILRVVLFGLLMLVIVELSPIVTSFFSGEMLALVGTGIFFLTFFLQYLVVLGFLHWEGRESISSLGVDLEDKNLLPHLVIGCISAVMSVILIAGFALLFGGDLRLLSDINSDLIAGEIIISVPTAFFEELCYRGYFTPRAVDLWGRTKGIVFTSLFFSLLHFSWWMPLGSIPIHLILLFTFNLFLGGVVLSISYYQSGKRLWIPIGFHFGWNFCGYILFLNFPFDSVASPEIFQFEWGITTPLGFLLGLSLIWLLLAELSRKKK